MFLNLMHKLYEVIINYFSGYILTQHEKVMMKWTQGEKEDGELYQGAEHIK